MASGVGFPVDSTPTPNSVGVWSREAIGNAYGHVAVVLAVNGDGTVTVEDYNWKSFAYSRHTMSTSGARFIHFSDSLTSGTGAIESSGGLRVFARGRDSGLWQYWSPNESGYQWQPIGGEITSSPAAVVYGVPRVFARGRDGALWQYSSQDGWNWQWQPIGGEITSSPAAVVYDGALEVFARGRDGALWQYWWDGSRWQWQSLGGEITSGTSAVVYDGALEVFARGRDGALWQYWWDGSQWQYKSEGGQIV